MDKEKSEAAKRMFWPRFFWYSILFLVFGFLLSNLFLELIGHNVFMEFIGRNRHNAYIPATSLVTVCTLLIAARIVKRAGASQMRTVRYRLTSPRPSVDLPASEIRSDRDVWGGLALFCAFFGLLILVPVVFLGGTNVEYGYGAGIFFVLFSLFFGWLWKKNGYLICRIDEHGITSFYLKANRLMHWGEIASCEVVYNLVGPKVQEQCRFLNKDQQAIGSVGLQDASAKQRTLFLNQLECWFAERSNGIAPETETTEEPTPTPQHIVESQNTNNIQRVGKR